jgi:hypothetical protein
MPGTSRKGRKEFLTNTDGGWVQPYRPCAGDCTTQLKAFNPGASCEGFYTAFTIDPKEQMIVISWHNCIQQET